MLYTPIQCTGIRRLSKICRHKHAFFYHVLITKYGRIHVQFFCQFIHCRFQRKNSLRCPITPVCTRRLKIRIYNIIIETVRFQWAGIHRDWFMSGQSNRRRSMFSIGTGIRQCININRTNLTILICAQTKLDLHLVSRRSCDLWFFSCIDDLGRTPCLPGNKCRIDITYRRLLRSEATTNTRFLNPDFALGNAKCACDNSSGVEHDLRRWNHMKSSIAVDFCITSECLHHCLIEGFRVIYMINDHVTISHHGIHITLRISFCGNQIPLMVSTPWAILHPFFLRMHQNLAVFCCMIIKHRFQYLIFYLN